MTDKYIHTPKYTYPKTFIEPICHLLYSQVGGWKETACCWEWT